MEWGSTLISQFGCDVFLKNHLPRNSLLINDEIIQRELNPDAIEDNYSSTVYRNFKTPAMKSEYNTNIYLKKPRFPCRLNTMRHSFNSNQNYETINSQERPNVCNYTNVTGSNDHAQYRINMIKQPMSHLSRMSIGSNTSNYHQYQQVSRPKPKVSTHSKPKFPLQFEQADTGTTNLPNSMVTPLNQLSFLENHNRVLPINSIPQQAAQAAKTFVDLLRKFVSASEIDQVKGLLKTALSQVMQSRDKSVVQGVLQYLIRKIKIGSLNDILKFILNSVIFNCWVALNVTQFLFNAIQFLEGNEIRSFTSK